MVNLLHFRIECIDKNYIMNELTDLNNEEGIQNNKKDNVEISKDVLRIIHGEGFDKVEKGFFANVPDLYGFMYKFPSDKTETTYLIVNTNPDFQYPNPISTIKNYTFFIINAPSIEEAAEAIKSMYNDIIQTIQEKNNIKKERLPYGYTRDENDQIAIVPEEAEEVRKIFKMFPNLGSIRKVAMQLNTNFSRVREILHDARYGELYPSIVPMTELKRVKQKLYQNRKNKTTAKENKVANIKRQIASGIRR